MKDNVETLSDTKYATDYYPFGMGMPNRSWSAGEYRFGFDGKENDDEVKGDGNSLDFGARIYDPRLGRWLSIDPFVTKYPNLSAYCFSTNSPIWLKDVDGRYFTGNIEAVKAIYATISELAQKGDESAKQFKAALESMDASDVEFNIQNTSKPPSEIGFEGGKTSFDETNNRVVIDAYNFGSEEYPVSQKARMGHELKHGSQFLEGELDFINDKPGQFYDEVDEEKAYQISNLITNTQLKPDQREKTDDDARVQAGSDKKTEKTILKEQSEDYKKGNKNSNIKLHSVYNYRPTENQKKEKKTVLNKSNE